MAKNRSKLYIGTYLWLMLLTALEVAVVLIGWPQMAIVIFMLSAAIAKAMLIALFFMHLKDDKPWVWLLPGIPVALGLFFVLMMFPDMVYHLVYVF